jgi:lipopolysaccharide biosynthesis regulator YciM
VFATLWQVKQHALSKDESLKVLLSHLSKNYSALVANELLFWGLKYGDFPDQHTGLLMQVKDKLNQPQALKCPSCGLTSQVRHWQCPKCLSWSANVYTEDIMVQPLPQVNLNP